jgi:hypothetical protein
MQNIDGVSPDFPRDSWPAALSGAHNKLSVRLIDGRYVAGLTGDERAERFAICSDLVKQLVAYCHRKQAERPKESLDSLLKRVDAAVRKKGWDVSPVELDWCLAKVKDRL